MRHWSWLVLCGGVVLGVSACGSSAPSGSGSNPTTPITGTTLPLATLAPIITTTLPSAPTTTLPTSNSTSGSGATTTVPGRTVSSPSDNVHLGDSGPGVKQIQTALVAHGFKVVVDGKFGPQTQKAVKAFQKQAKIKQDGIVGPATWSRLSAAPSATTTTVKASTTTTT